MPQDVRKPVFFVRAHSQRGTIPDFQTPIAATTDKLSKSLLLIMELIINIFWSRWLLGPVGHETCQLTALNVEIWESGIQTNPQNENNQTEKSVLPDHVLISRHKNS